VVAGRRIRNRVGAARLGESVLDGVFGGNKPSAPSSGPTAAKAPAAGKAPIKLEKISNTQGRDWKAEEKKIAASAAPPKVIDLQPKSYNYGKAGEFPNLYKGWLKSGGDQIANQMIASAKKAIANKFKLIEILFDPVPNLDEVAVGTIYNAKLRFELSALFKVPDYATNRGSTSFLEWANLYWATRLVSGLGGKVLVVSISGEGLRGQFLPQLPKGMTLVSISNVGKIDDIVGPGYKPTAVVVISPCTDSHYATVKQLGDKFGCPGIALNAPFSKGYDIGGPTSFELAYVMKRVPKGWLFRNLGGAGDFQAIVEGPDYAITKSQSFNARPTLPAVSKINMAASAQLYGPAGNDRIFSQRL